MSIINCDCDDCIHHSGIGRCEFDIIHIDFNAECKSYTSRRSEET